jgi:tagaturonate reductase
MILSLENISKISGGKGVDIPKRASFSMPEKVLQFGTGVLLRGLPDYFINKANQNNIFNGRIVVVKSTEKGDAGAFDTQDGLYTVCIRGLENGKQVDKKVINASISRVLSAQTQWLEILACASNPDLRVIISNTTEMGIKLMEEDLISALPPVSFPGKLLSFLYKRFLIFKGSEESGMVILPTELIPVNGELLKQICVRLAEINHYGPVFMNWLIKANDFCNTLVDRIVPGALPYNERQKVLNQLGYEDHLMIMAEPYSLWAIETSRSRTREILSFAKDEKGVILTERIDKHRELKLRLLNAPHTFVCALAIWSRYSTVKEAMQHDPFRSLITELIYQEIIPSITNGEIGEKEAKTFAAKVLDRFSNPFIDHEWISISFQYTSKISMRCIPVLLNYYKREGKAPHYIALGFAAYILFMCSQKNEKGEYTGKMNGTDYVINDDKASILHTYWQKGSTAEVVNAVLSDESLWNTDLTDLFQFEKTVLDNIERIKNKKIESLLQSSITL